MKQEYSKGATLLFASPDGSKIGKLAKLELISIALEQLLKEDESLWPPHQQLVEIRDAVYEFLGAVDDFLDDDPTPQFLYDNTGGEPGVSSQELWATDFNKKQQLTH